MTQMRDVVAPPFMRPKPRMLPLQPGVQHRIAWCPMEICNGGAVGSSLAAEGAFRAHLMAWRPTKLVSRTSHLAFKA